MNGKPIRILMLPVGGPPYETTVANELYALQRLVGGSFELARLERGVDLWVNEDAVGLNLPDNRAAPRNIAVSFLNGWIQGPAFVARTEDEELADLTDADVAKWKRVFG